MASFVYRHPILYNLMLKAIHQKALNRRYRYISKSIGKNKTVFELGCGTARMHKFLHRSCKYVGWDLNRTFVEYCRRKGINAKTKDIFDFSEYPENDVTVICDVLHHVFPNDRSLVEHAAINTKKLIIIEPYDIGKVRLPNFIIKRLQAFDDDGINEDDERHGWGIGQYKKILEKFGSSIMVKTKQINLDLVAVFDLRKAF